MRNSIGSMPSFSAIPSTASSSAIMPEANPDALNRRRPVCGVVGDKGALKRHFHGATHGLRGQCCQHSVGSDKQLATEAAADEGRVEPDVLHRYAESLGDILLPPVDHLI